MQKTYLELKLKQQLFLSLEMKLAFEILQMPIIELAEWLKVRIEENPLLELIQEEAYEDEMEDVLYKDESLFEDDEQNDSNTKQEIVPFIENIPRQDNLRDHLLQQAREQFTDLSELHLAERIIDSLDAKGFFVANWEVFAPEYDPIFCNSVLKSIQNFDPVGIAAGNIQESLLIQLHAKGKQGSLAHVLLENYYDDLLHYRLLVLKKKLGLTVDEISEAIKRDIAPLNIYPGCRFQNEAMPPLYPDVIIKKEEEKWTIDVRDDMLPRFKVSSLEDHLWQSCSKEEKNLLQKHLKEGNLLLHFIDHRQKTLKSLIRYLIYKQEHFLSGDASKLAPLTMKEAACALHVHPSTISRVTDHKYLFCSHGLIPLKSLFTIPLDVEKEELVSNQEAKQLLLQLIQKENKSRPLTDEGLAKEMKKEGVSCSRRTVAKYRHSLSILPASKRRFALRNSKSKSLSI